MNIRIVFRNMEKSEQLEQRVRTELKKLDKFIAHSRTPVNVDVVITTQGVDHNVYSVELLVDYAQNKLRAHDEGLDLPAMIAQAVRKMEQEMEKIKGKAIDKRDKPDEDRDPARREKEEFED